MQGYSRPRLAVAAVAASAASLGGLALGAASAHAASTITVNPGGSIAAGLAQANAGDTVTVAAGTYNESITAKAGVTIVGAPNHGSHITGITATATGAVVDGFLVDDNGSGTAVVAKGSVTVRNNQISNSGHPSDTLVAATPTTAAYATGGKPAVTIDGAVTFSGNIVDHSKYIGVMVSGGTGALITGNDIGTSYDTFFDPSRPDVARYAAGISVKTSSVTVSANFLHDNQDSGLQFYSSAGAGNNGNQGLAVNNVVVNNGDHGIDNLGVTGGRIVNNTVVGNSNAGINVEGASTGYTVQNNIAQDNGTAAGARSRGDIRIAQDATQAGATTVDHNLLYQSNAADVYYTWDSVNASYLPSGTTGVNKFYGGTGNLPVGNFVGDTTMGGADKFGAGAFLGAGNWHIAANSPAANLANHAAAGVPGFDKDGNAWAGSAGAYNAGSTGGPGNVVPGNGPAVVRLGGTTRFDTGVIVSQRAFPGTTKDVVIATGYAFPDALSGVPLAKQLNAPLLLVDGKTPAANAEVKGEIKRLLAAGGTLHVLGGTAAVSDAVVTDLLPSGAGKDRLSGATRYETSVAIAHKLGDPKNVVVARGDDGVNQTGFADALSAGPYAANVFGGGNAAVLLSANTTLDPAVKTYLAGATSVQAIGGPAATAVGTGGHVVPAIVGSDRYDTAAQVAAKFPSEKTAGVAFGLRFPDALTGAALLAVKDGPLLLTATDAVPSQTKVQLAGIGSALGTSGTIYVFGGPAVITEGARGAIATAAGGRLA